MKTLFPAVVLLLAVAGCAERIPLLQSQVDQQTAARAGVAYRGPGAGPELSEAEYARQHPPRPVAATVPLPLPSPRKMSEYKVAVANTLRDPGAAQFRDVRMARTDDGKPAIYGELNAKNGYGGYVGFSVFCGVIIEGTIGRVAVVWNAHDMEVAEVQKKCGQ